MGSTRKTFSSNTQSRQPSTVPNNPAEKERRGIIRRVVTGSPKNPNWYVIQCDSEDLQGWSLSSGKFNGMPVAGDNFIVRGNWKSDDRFGWQFQGWELAMARSPAIAAFDAPAESTFVPKDHNQTQVCGCVQRVPFAKAENRYYITLVESVDGVFSARGVFSSTPRPGCWVTCDGRWVQDEKFGWQFMVKFAKVELPNADDRRIANYLRDFLKAHGFKPINIADDIVKQFGIEALNHMADVGFLKGLPLSPMPSDVELLKFVTDLQDEAHSDPESFAFLVSDCKFWPKQAVDILNSTRSIGWNLREKIPQAPWSLYWIVKPRLDFKRMDELACEMNVLNPLQRACVGLVQAWKLYVQGQGHTCMSKDAFFDKIDYEVRRAMQQTVSERDRSFPRAFGPIHRELFDQAVDELIHQHKYFVVEQVDGVDMLTQRKDAEAEVMTARELQRIMDPTVPDRLDIVCSGRNRDNTGIMLDTNIGLDVEGILNQRQRQAFDNALKHRVSIVTGPAGSGKTTLVNQILQWCHANSNESSFVTLLAPTGAAAKRCQSVTKKPAHTQHSHIASCGLVFGENDEHGRPYPQTVSDIAVQHDRWGKTGYNLGFTGELAIFDEQSMSTARLVYKNLKRIPPGSHVVFIGDNNQLPSIKQGNLLRDLIDCGKIPVTELSMVYRNDGDILNVCQAVLQKKVDPIISTNSDSYYFVDIDTIDVATVLDIVTKNLVKYKNDWTQMCLLSPRKAGVFGVNNLNTAIQQLMVAKYNREQFLKYGHENPLIFYEGDRVMQIRNDKKVKKVINGDYGIVQRVAATEKQLDVLFDNALELTSAPRTYKLDELVDLMLSYVNTVHKVQGNEFPLVIVILDKGSSFMVNRSMLYTAFSRAKKELIVISSREVLEEAVNRELPPRDTRLVQRLREILV